MASRAIEDLTPRMQEKIRRFEICLEVGIPGTFKRSCTYRSQEEQNELFRRGRNGDKRPKVTWTTLSVHTSGEAVDYFIEREGKYCNDLKIDTDGDKIEDWQEFGKIAATCGLEWGGTWPRHPDIPHVQWADA
jgi:hypothetical protein